MLIDIFCRRETRVNKNYLEGLSGVIYLNLYPHIFLENPESHDIIPGLGDLKPDPNAFESPDEIFVKYFTEDEL